MFRKFDDEEHRTRNEYQKKWRAPHALAINAERRRKYAVVTDLAARREARRAMVQSTNAKRKADYRALVDTEKDKPCADCRNKFPPECMDFDHVRGEKRYGIGKMGQMPLVSVMAEIAKCDVVCANCHRIRTRDRRQHGYGRPKMVA